MPLLLLFFEALFHVLQIDLSSLNVVEDDLELLILLPPPPECWDDRWVTPVQLQNAFFKTKKKRRKNPTKCKKDNKI